MLFRCPGLSRPVVKACCALVDAWGSRGEAPKAAELLEELEDLGHPVEGLEDSWGIVIQWWQVTAVRYLLNMVIFHSYVSLPEGNFYNL